EPAFTAAEAAHLAAHPAAPMVTAHAVAAMGAGLAGIGALLAPLGEALAHLRMAGVELGAADLAALVGVEGGEALVGALLHPRLAGGLDLGLGAGAILGDTNLPDPRLGARLQFGAGLRTARAVAVLGRALQGQRRGRQQG